jgi:hypothetical protein
MAIAVRIIGVVCVLAGAALTVYTAREWRGSLDVSRVYKAMVRAGKGSSDAATDLLRLYRERDSFLVVLSSSTTAIGVAVLPAPADALHLLLGVALLCGQAAIALLLLSVHRHDDRLGGDPWGPPPPPGGGQPIPEEEVVSEARPRLVA